MARNFAGLPFQAYDLDAFRSERAPRGLFAIFYAPAVAKASCLSSLAARAPVPPDRQRAAGRWRQRRPGPGGAARLSRCPRGPVGSGTVLLWLAAIPVAR